MIGITTQCSKILESIWNLNENQDLYLLRKRRQNLQNLLLRLNLHLSLHLNLRLLLHLRLPLSLLLHLPLPLSLLLNLHLRLLLHLRLNLRLLLHLRLPLSLPLLLIAQKPIVKPQTFFHLQLFLTWTGPAEGTSPGSETRGRAEAATPSQLTPTLKAYSSSATRPNTETSTSASSKSSTAQGRRETKAATAVGCP